MVINFLTKESRLYHSREHKHTSLSSDLSVFSLPVLLGLLAVRVSVHGLGARSPLSRTDFSELVSVLECLDQSQDLINVPAHRQVTDGDVSQDTVSINDVSGSVGNSLIFSMVDQAPVSLRYFPCHVSNEGNVHLAETALLPVLLSVLHVGELGVSGSSNHLAVDGSELLGSVRELDDLGRAHKGEVEGVEEEHHVLAFVVAELDLLEAIEPGVDFKVRGRLSDLGNSEALANVGAGAGRSTGAVVSAD